MKIRLRIMATLGLVTLLPTAALVLVSHERTANRQKTAHRPEYRTDARRTTYRQPQ